jgi:amidophosphoribosyltransferase
MLHEECGVFGVFSNADELDVAAATYHGLFALQHRGQESCGIYVNDRGVQTGHKAKGLVNDVFTEQALKGLGQGRMAVGHVRYGSAQSNRARNAQPMHVNHSNGSLVLAHNGCITNAGFLRRHYEFEGCIFHTTSEAEVISYAITRERLMVDSIEEAVQEAYKVLEGAFSMVMMSAQKLIACRDPYGFRPLCIGKLGESFVVASETCALDAVGAKFLRDVLPGEIVVIDHEGLRSLKTYVNPKHPKCMCAFEYIYFARPDSVIDKNSVHISRENAGKILAQTYPIKADVVIGLPDSGLHAAIGYAKASKIPYAIGFNKNRYIGRTFIQPMQGQRSNSVRIKLNPVSSVVKGKRVIAVDDSIVRGTTTLPTLQLLREAGAKEIHMLFASPPYKFPCYYGTDVKNKEDLIANQYDTLEEFAKAIGADSLGFFPADQLHKLVRPGQGLCTACFDGEYPVQPKGAPLAKYDKKLP